MSPQLPLGTAKNLAFDNTWPAILAGAQSKTRRKWTNATARRTNPGMLFAAWTAHYTNAAGRHFGWIVIEAPAPRPDPGQMPRDWVSEAWEYFHQHPEHVPIVNNSPYCQSASMVRNFKSSATDQILFVVRFAAVGLTWYGRAQAEKMGIEVPAWLDDPWPGDLLYARNHWASWSRKWANTLSEVSSDEAIRAGQAASELSELAEVHDPILAQRIAKPQKRRKSA